MSLVTRCPACGTLFKVVTDQLKISEGWVRCGQCAHIFDAQAHLVGDEQLQAATVLKRDIRPEGSPLEGIALSHETANPQTKLEQIQKTLHTPFADSVGQASVGAESQDSRMFKPGLLRDAGDMDSDAGPSTSTWAESAQAVSQLEPPLGATVSQSAEPTTVNSASSVTHNDATTLDPALMSDAPNTTPNFVKQARRAERWRSPWIRFALGMLFVALLALLGLQIALQEKDRLAAVEPALKPWLEQICQRTGCRVEPMKRIESIAVDASSFNRINKNNPQLEAVSQTYRLSVTLKNTHSLPVALPHVELSLQDTQDQPILRRVLSPADLGWVTESLAPTQDLNGSLTVQIDAAKLAGSRINGYRVLAFYP